MRTYWLWLALHPELTEHEKCVLAQCCGDPEDLFFPEREGLWPEELAPQVAKARSSRDLKQTEQVIARCARENVEILTFGDEAYPARLKHISDPPVVLYYKGTLPNLNDIPVIGVVGTRSASAYGVNSARQLGFQIARCGGASGPGRGDAGPAPEQARPAGSA